MAKVLGGVELQDIVELTTNVLEIKEIEGNPHVYLNGVEVFDINPQIEIDASTMKEGRGVLVHLDLFAEIKTEK